MNILSMKEKVKILRALVEGCSIRSTERMTGHHRDTIMRLMYKTGKKCRLLMDLLMQNINAKRLQVDELWTFVKKKDKELTWHERKMNKLGSQYIFVAMDSDTKLVPCFRVGKRDWANALPFMMDLRRRIKGSPHITTDSMPSYAHAVKRAFGKNVDYAQLVKVYKKNGDHVLQGYSPVDFVLTTKWIVCGKPDSRYISTSYIERQNLTLRTNVRRLTRLTNGFSKKYENLVRALYLHFANYNFVRVHGSLKMTPAMKAGITDHVWDIEEILRFGAN